MSAYMLLFTTAALMKMIQKAKSDDFPKGRRVSLVTKQPMTKFRPVDQVSKVEAKQELCEIR